MFIAFAIQYWKYIAIVAALAALFTWHKLETRAAFKAGVASEQTKARIEAGNRIKDMETNDEAFRKLPAFERCRAFMRDSGLSIDHCDQR
jgi:hypothetical protein